MENNKKILNVPNLRFPEFIGEYNSDKFANIFSFLNNNSFSRDMLNYDAGKYKNIHYGDILIKFPTIVDCDTIKIPFINDNVIISSKMNILKSGDIIIADTAEDYTAGKVIEVITRNNNVLSGLHTIPCRPSIKFYNGYIGYYLNSYSFREKLIPLIQGIKVYSVSKHMYKDLYVNYPSYAEQKKVTDILIKIDKRIETQNKIIEDLKALKNTIKNYIYCKFDKYKLSEYVTLKNGYAFQSNKYIVNGRYEVITISNVSGDRYISQSSNRIDEIPSDIQPHQILNIDDILVSMTGNVGRVSIVNRKNCLLNQRVGLLKIIDGNSEAIFQLLQSKQFEKYLLSKSQGAAQLNTSKSDIEEFLIPYSTNKEFSQFIVLLKNIDYKILIENSILENHLKIKKYLLDNLFI